MGIFICKICKKEFNTLNGIRSHSFQKHNISSEKIYIDYILNGKSPKCECGCGGKTKFISIGKGFSKFINSHNNRVKGKNNFHKNPETHKKAIETQKKNWKDGKYKGWWENKSQDTLNKIEGIKKKLKSNKERSEKISKKLKGTTKSEETKRKISESQKKRYQNNTELKENLSKKRIKWLKSKQSNKKSKIEFKFENILNIMEVDFIFQYEMEGRLFDFYIPSKKTLIEVDGDFYHCNPKTKHKDVIYETQLNTKKNDDFKNKLCEKNNITLIRYWEKDINEKPEWVISDLKNRLSI